MNYDIRALGRTLLLWKTFSRIWRCNPCASIKFPYSPLQLAVMRLAYRNDIVGRPLSNPLDQRRQLAQRVALLGIVGVSVVNAGDAGQRMAEDGFRDFMLHAKAGHHAT